MFSEGSAKSGESVEEAFQKLTHTVIYKIESGEIPEDLVTTAKRTANQSLKDAINPNEKKLEPGRCAC